MARVAWLAVLLLGCGGDKGGDSGGSGVAAGTATGTAGTAGPGTGSGGSGTGGTATGGPGTGGTATGGGTGTGAGTGTATATATGTGTGGTGICTRRCDADFTLVEAGAIVALEGCHTVTGSVNIVNAPGLTDLSAASCLERVDGDLLLSRVADLENLDGLSRLASVGGDLRMDGLDSLADASGLSSLLIVGGELALTQTPVDALVLPSLTGVGGSLTLVDDAGLATLALDALTTVGALDLRGAPVLGTPSFAALASVDGDLRLADLSSLTSAGFPALTEVGGSLSATDLPVWVTVSGFGSLERVGVDLVLEAVAVEVITGLRALTAVDGELRVVDTPVRDLTPLGGLAVGAVTVHRNPELEALGVLDGVATVPGTVDIQDNAALADLGAAALTDIGGDLRITLNRALCQSRVDALVSRIVVSGSVFAFGNDGGC